MKLKLIPHGTFIRPTRSHYNDSGLDVYSPIDCDIEPMKSAKIPLNYGFDIPDGLELQLRPRSSMNAKGLLTQFGTIDAGYKGNISVIIVNLTSETYHIGKGDKIAQLVLCPVVYCDAVDGFDDERGEKGFGSTGK